MTSLLDRASRLALNVLFPLRCALCGAHGTLLCDACVLDLPVTVGARCDRCWMPLPHGPNCAHCEDFPPAFVSIRSACVMEGGARRLAHELKYEGLTSLAEPMAAFMLQQLQLPGLDLVVPVPLHRSRQRSRGYNQAAMLAKHVAVGLGHASDDTAVRRTRSTAPLAKTMHRDERRSIVAG